VLSQGLRTFTDFRFWNSSKDGWVPSHQWSATDSDETLFLGLLTTSHIVKYHEPVHIVTRKHLSEAVQAYPDAANEIKAWMSIVKEVRWHNFAEVRSTFKDADNVNGYMIFNIRRNRYRLVTVIHYAKTTDQKRTQGHVYIRSFLTHKEYDNPATGIENLVQNEHTSSRSGQDDCQGRSSRHSQ
jgi:mRNA interferase HigB